VVGLGVFGDHVQLPGNVGGGAQEPAAGEELVGAVLGPPEQGALLPDRERRQDRPVGHRLVAAPGPDDPGVRLVDRREEPDGVEGPAPGGQRERAVVGRFLDNPAAVVHPALKPPVFLVQGQVLGSPEHLPGEHVIGGNLPGVAVDDRMAQHQRVQHGGKDAGVVPVADPLLEQDPPLAQLDVVLVLPPQTGWVVGGQLSPRHEQALDGRIVLQLRDVIRPSPARAQHGPAGRHHRHRVGRPGHGGPPPGGRDGGAECRRGGVQDRLDERGDVPLRPAEDRAGVGVFRSDLPQRLGRPGGLAGEVVGDGDLRQQGGPVDAGVLAEAGDVAPGPGGLEEIAAVELDRPKPVERLGARAGVEIPGDDLAENGLVAGGSRRRQHHGGLGVIEASVHPQARRRHSGGDGGGHRPQRDEPPAVGGGHEAGRAPIQQGLEDLDRPGVFLPPDQLAGLGQVIGHVLVGVDQREGSGGVVLPGGAAGRVLQGGDGPEDDLSPHRRRGAQDTGRQGRRCDFLDLPMHWRLVRPLPWRPVPHRPPGPAAPSACRCRRTQSRPRSHDTRWRARTSTFSAQRLVGWGRRKFRETPSHLQP